MTHVKYRDHGPTISADPSPDGAPSRVPLQLRALGAAGYAAQAMALEPARQPRPAAQGRLPGPLRTGLESLSGMDMSGVRVHRNSPKPAEVGAHAYTQSRDIYVASGREQHLPHEGWHAVQQMQGRVTPTTQAKSALINDDSALEREADVMGARALALGARSASGQGHGVGGPASTRPLPQATHGSGASVVQRYAFIKGAQVDESEKSLTAPMKSMASDALVRDYESRAEFQSHAGKATDYIGNLVGPVEAGTWVRFAKTGMNILGENHTQVEMSGVTPAVGSTNFIYEQFSSDDLTKSPNLNAAYEGANQVEFKKLGIGGKKDKQGYGGESLYPKLGFAFTTAQPYFTGSSPLSDLLAGGYLGKPLQRYLTIGWGFSKDNATQKGLPAKAAALAKVHAAVTSTLDPFIAGLTVDGYLGDELHKVPGGAKKLLPPLAQFAAAMIDCLAERAAGDKGNRLTKRDRKTLGSDKTSGRQKGAAFARLRDLSFEDNVKAAAARGVRYAGMGQFHLDHLKKVGMPSGSTGYEMAGKDLSNFVAHTKKLAKQVKKAKP